MKHSLQYVLCLPALLLAAESASAAIVHAFSAVSVPVDSPWALGALGALVAVIAARVIRKR